MLKLIVVSLVAGASLASAADDAGEKKDKPKGGKGVMAADADKDGKVTAEELKKWGADRKKPMTDKQAEKMFARFDTNKDGSIDAEEVKAARKKGGKKPKGEGGKKKPEGEAKDAG